MRKEISPNQDLATYCAGLLEIILRDTAFALRSTLDNPDEKNIYELRRLVLRVRHALRHFGGELPGRGVKKVRKRLGELQDLLAEVHSWDAASRALRSGSIASATAAPERTRMEGLLEAGRRKSLRPLRARLQRMQSRDTLKRWRNRLLMPS